MEKNLQLCYFAMTIVHLFWISKIVIKNNNQMHPFRSKFRPWKASCIIAVQTLDILILEACVSYIIHTSDASIFNGKMQACTSCELVAYNAKPTSLSRWLRFTLPSKSKGGWLSTQYDEMGSSSSLDTIGQQLPLYQSRNFYLPSQIIHALFIYEIYGLCSINWDLKL